MSLSPAGRNLTWKDAGNGRLTLDWGVDGNPKFDDNETELIFSLLLESGWFGDPSGKRRSLVPTVKTNDSGTAGRLKQYAEDAMQSGIDDGRLKSATATVGPTATGYQIAISCVTASGKSSAQTISVTT